MKLRRSHVLRAFIVWTFFTWSVLAKNMITTAEHPLEFRLVHLGLALISVSMAAACWPLAKRLDASREHSN